MMMSIRIKTYIICYILALLPGLIFFFFWYSTMSFIHEVGHIYFAFLTGDSSIIIYNNPPSASIIVPVSTIGKILVPLGGIIFTFLFSIILMFLIILFFSFKNWDIQIGKRFGYETYAFQMILPIVGYFFLELVNLLPIETETDMAKLLEYLNLDFIPSLSNDVIQIFSLISILVILLFVHFLGNTIFCSYLTIQTLRNPTNIIE